MGNATKLINRRTWNLAYRWNRVTTNDARVLCSYMHMYTMSQICASVGSHWWGWGESRGEGVLSSPGRNTRLCQCTV